MTNPNDTEMSLIEHLVELRGRLLNAIIAILLIFLCLFYFANDIFNLLAQPLMRHLPESTSMVAIDVASPFLTPLKLTLFLSLFIAMPVIFYQMWAFVAPGLYKNEKQLVAPLLASSTLLFYLGMAFAYYLVFPLVFGFFTAVAPEGVEISTDISRYLDFVLKMFFAFGITFEIPILIILLVWTGFTTPESLASKRPYMVVGAFIVAMLLTPADVFSQSMLAIPMLLLFEVGIILSRLLLKRRQAQENDIAANDFEPLTETEMDAELDRVEASEDKPIKD
ncbi:MAG: twin-arginine translocase subunit TatC [Pseudomonadota bacterium]